jgi:hypothetical protein
LRHGGLNNRRSPRNKKMPIPDDQQRSLVAERLDEFQKAFARLSPVAETQEQCRQAARELMAALQGLLNRLRT